jgi:hypothetical protein
MSWMIEHWDKKYLKMAENTIKKLVSHFRALLEHTPVLMHAIDGRVPKEVE